MKDSKNKRSKAAKNLILTRLLLIMKSYMLGQ